MHIYIYIQTYLTVGRWPWCRSPALRCQVSHVDDFGTWRVGALGAQEDRLVSHLVLHPKTVAARSACWVRTAENLQWIPSGYVKIAMENGHLHWIYL